MATTTNCIWDEQNYLAESDGTNTINVVYTNEPKRYGELISSRVSGATSYHEFDGLGSTRQLINATGGTTDTAVYGAWGDVAARSGSSQVALLWVGQLGYYSDLETGTLSVRERNYGAAIGRWTSMDPRFPVASNRYVYVTNAPPRSADPSGLDPGIELQISSAGRMCAPCGSASLTWKIEAPTDPAVAYPLLIVQEVSIDGFVFDCEAGCRCFKTGKARAAKCKFLEYLGTVGAQAAQGATVDPKKLKPVDDNWKSPFRDQPTCSGHGALDISAEIHAISDPGLARATRILGSQDGWQQLPPGQGIKCGSSDNPNVQMVYVDAGPRFRLGAAPGWWSGAGVQATGRTLMLLNWVCCPGDSQYAATDASGEGWKEFAAPCMPYI